MPEILALIVSYLDGEKILALRCLFGGTRNIHERVAELRAVKRLCEVVI